MAGDLMTAKEWQLKQREEQNVLLKQDTENMTNRERDIWNLKWLKANIGYQSRLFRQGCYSSLQRAIKSMESDKIE